MGRFKKFALAAAAALLVVGHHVIMNGTTAAMVAKFGAWSYLIDFVWLMFGTTLVLGPTAFLKRFPRIAKRLVVDPKRFETPFWKRVRSRGVLPMAVLSTILLAPIVTGALLRLIGLSERRVWMNAVISNAVVAAIVVSFYLGVIGLIRAKIHGLI